MASDLPPPTPDTVQALADALRQEHVIVSPAMGSGDAGGTYDRVRALIARLPFPAYVALVPRPTDAVASTNTARDVARAVSRRIGEPGLYVVATGSSVPEAIITVSGIDPTLYSLTLYSNEKKIGGALGTDSSRLAPGVFAESALETALRPIPEPEHGTYPANLSPDAVAALAAREQALALPERAASSAEVAEPWSRGGRIALFVALFVGVGLTVRQCVAGWPGWRRRGPVRVGGTPAVAAAAPPEPGPIRTRASAELEALVELLDRLASRMRSDTSGLTDSATLARDTAEHLLGSSDPALLVGALTLAQTGRRDAERAFGEATARFHCCYFNPLHGECSGTTAWRLGEAQLTIPVCQDCHRRAHAGKQPDALLVRRGRRTRPYYEHDDVWARTGYGSLVDDYAARVLAERGRR